MSRRLSLIIIVALGLLGPPFARGAKFTKGEQVAPFTPEFKPGDYVGIPRYRPLDPWSFSSVCRIK